MSDGYPRFASFRTFWRIALGAGSRRLPAFALGFSVAPVLRPLLVAGPPQLDPCRSSSWRAQLTQWLKHASSSLRRPQDRVVVSMTPSALYMKQVQLCLTSSRYIDALGGTRSLQTHDCWGARAGPAAALLHLNLTALWRT